jgi:predicted metalloenzyme YecM
MLQKIAIFVAAVGVALVMKPELVLHLPNGFIPYAILGHPPPAYFMYDAWKDGEHETWLKDGDLVTCVGAKSGTNWLLYMSHLIRVKGNVKDFPFTDVLETTPWPTLRHYPGQQWPEVKSKMNTTILADGSKLKDKWDHPSYPFRIFKSHELPNDQAGEKTPDMVLPVRSRKKVKFLAAVRNPYDQLRSFYPFFASHSPRFRRMWGDFPPVYANKDQMMADFLDGGVMGALVWAYPVIWFPYRNDPNVLLFNYDDMLKDPKGHVERLAKFLEVDLSAEQIDTITHLTSFAEMKKVSDRFDYFIWGHPDPYHIMTSGKLLRAGKKGEGKEFFTPEELKKISDDIDKHFSPELKEFMHL